MADCEGEVSESWRRYDGFWGKVAESCGHVNSDYIRKSMYMLWHNGTGNVEKGLVTVLPLS